MRVRNIAKVGGSCQESSRTSLFFTYRLFSVHMPCFEASTLSFDSSIVSQDNCSLALDSLVFVTLSDLDNGALRLRAVGHRGVMMPPIQGKWSVSK